MTKSWFQSFLSLIFPPCCVVCGNRLNPAEEFICVGCHIRMPRVQYQKDLRMEQLFWGQLPLGRVAAYFHYHKGSHYRKIVHELKYQGNRRIGETVGRYMGQELMDKGFFKGIDVIIPIPLHTKKLKKRGYNQSECFAKGLAMVSGLPIDTTAVVRKQHTDTQTKKSVSERWENVKEAFQFLEPSKWAGKHILLVDDVLTTGSTIVACGQHLKGVEGVTISVATIGWAVP